jgi:peptidylprolyl isomerase
MTDYKQIIIAFLATIVLIAGLAGWTAYRNGESVDLFKDTSPLENVEIPLSPDAATQQTPPTNDAMTPNAQQQSQTSPTPMKNQKALFETTEGTFTIELFNEQMPITAGNFEKLAGSGYYDGTKFHRIIDGFMVQGGDPNTKSDDTSKYGTGGPGYAIQDEFVQGMSNVRGTISMANSGPNTGGSQFFINLVDNTFLDFDKSQGGKHPVFGRVVEGMDIVDKIAKQPKNQRDVPLTPIVVKSVKIVE